MDFKVGDFVIAEGYFGRVTSLTPDLENHIEVYDYGCGTPDTAMGIAYTRLATWDEVMNSPYLTLGDKLEYVSARTQAHRG